MNKIKEQNNETLEELRILLNIKNDKISEYEKICLKDEGLLSILKRMKENNLHGFFDLDLESYIKSDEENKKIIIKDINAMIDIFLEETKK